MGMATRQELQEYFQVSYTTLRNWESQHGLPYYKIGGKVRYDWSEVKAWMNGEKQ